MYRRRSIFDSFTLSPLPYPVLLIIAVALILLGISSYINYVSIVESAGQRLNKNWILFSTPVLLIFLVRCLSSWDSADRFCASPPWDKRRRNVAAFIVLLLILVQYQSRFLDSWFG
ncbi:hypothetical protein CICLE_v10029987mg [Citrus x clementina]|uniref:Uncharacterized protein n=1 Tax=Citrus clementina TaxID=85681 RepID=V4UC16_CITCL|nr:hypothetical protein CICLE_v10029987mg [Citrus x clementina]